MKHRGIIRNKRLLKGAMLYTVLKAQRDNLNQRPRKRLTWRSSQTLSSVISITPALSEEAPLWSRDDRSLSEMKLFDNLDTNQLRANVYDYWAKSAWKRWLLRLWAGSSYQQVKVWFYVQESLAFRETEQSLPPENPCRALVTSYEQRVLENEQRLLENLGEWFFQQEESFKQSMKTRSNQWLNEHFLDELNNYEKRRSEKFFKQLQKEFRKFPGNDKQKREAHDKAQISYDEVGEIIRKHNMRLFQNMCAPSSQQQHASLNREEKLLSLIPSTQPTTVTIAPSSKFIANIKKNDGLDQLNITSWIKDKIRQAQTLLEQPESQERDEQIKELMSSSLKTLISQAKSSLELYESVANSVRDQYMEPDIALKRLKNTKSNLSIYFKQGNFLFHPDHFQAANRDLLTYWSQLFVHYKTFSNESIKSLKNSDIIIQERLLGKQRHQAILRQDAEAMLELTKIVADIKHLNKEIDLKLKQMVEDRKKWKEEMEVKIEEIQEVLFKHLESNSAKDSTGESGQMEYGEHSPNMPTSSFKP